MLEAQLNTLKGISDEAKIPKLIKPESASETNAQVTTVLVMKRILTGVKVAVNHEVLEVDESTWEGKICAIGLAGFFADGKGIGKIMSELTRRYNASDSGGNRTTVNDRLAMLVSKGVLDRRQEQNQWIYLQSPEFADRVKKAKGDT